MTLTAGKSLQMKKRPEDAVLPTNVENTMNRTCEKRGSVNENSNSKETTANNPKVSV